VKILVVVGSLRRAAFSRKLAQAAVSLAPEGAELELIDGRDLPHYDQDLDGEEKPEPVRKLVEQLNASDALLFVCPEFNYGIPGSLKNLIDWASRPAFRSPLKGKPSLIVGISIAPSGGARAHVQLSSVLAGTLTPVFVGPSFLVPAAHEKFGADGALSDEAIARRLSSTLQAFVAWAKEQRSS
jgi:chromate reductase